MIDLLATTTTTGAATFDGSSQNRLVVAGREFLYQRSDGPGTRAPRLSPQCLS